MIRATSVRACGCWSQRRAACSGQPRRSRPAAAARGQRRRSGAAAAPGSDGGPSARAAPGGSAGSSSSADHQPQRRRRLHGRRLVVAWRRCRRSSRRVLGVLRRAQGAARRAAQPPPRRRLVEHGRRAQPAASTTARRAATRASSTRSRSATTCAKASLNAGQNFIINVNGMPNYTGDIADVFSCIAPLGDGGCGFEHQLESVLRALGADGAPPPAQNAGFLRPDAYLAGGPPHQRGRLLGAARLATSSTRRSMTRHRSARAAAVVPLQRVRSPVRRQARRPASPWARSTSRGRASRPRTAASSASPTSSRRSSASRPTRARSSSPPSRDRRTRTRSTLGPSQVKGDPSHVALRRALVRRDRAGRTTVTYGDPAVRIDAVGRTPSAGNGRLRDDLHPDLRAGPPANRGPDRAGDGRALPPREASTRASAASSTRSPMPPESPDHAAAPLRGRVGHRAVLGRRGEQRRVSRGPSSPSARRPCHDRRLYHRDLHALIERRLVSVASRVGGGRARGVLVEARPRARRRCARDAGSRAGQTVITIPADANRDVDVLFMLDDSSNMTVYQEAARRRLLALHEHAQGAARRPAEPPHRGRLVQHGRRARSRASTAARRAAIRASSIRSRSARPVRGRASTPARTSSSNIDGQPNYTGDLADVFGCIALLGRRRLRLRAPTRVGAARARRRRRAGARRERRLPPRRRLPAGHPPHRRGRLLGAARLRSLRHDVDDADRSARSAAVVSLQRVRASVRRQAAATHAARARSTWARACRTRTGGCCRSATS